MKMWRERIAEAEARRFLWFFRWPRFTGDDMDAAIRINADVHPGKPLCAMAEARDRYGLIVPIPDLLWDLGMDFFRAVLHDDVPKASRLLDAIEDRALQLKREATS